MLGFLKNTKISRRIVMAPMISAVVHEMQKERGLSAGFISSKGSKFCQELPAQRKAPDDEQAAQAETLKSFDAASFGAGLVGELKAA